MSEIEKVFKQIEGYRDELIELQAALTSRVALGPDNGGSGEHEKTLFIKELLERVKEPVKEIILATNPDMEGEATAMFIRKQIKAETDKEMKTDKKQIKITRLAHGLPIGANLEYADERTLGEALEGRREY